MKKVKLMLMSLSVLAVVGGALAFSAKTGAKICTVDVNSDGSCPQFCASLRQKSTTNATFICTAPTIVNGIDLCHTAADQTAVCGAASVSQGLE
jgi:hypothetical protein